MNLSKNTNDSLISAGTRLRDNRQITVSPTVQATQYATDLIFDVSGEEPQIN